MNQSRSFKVVPRGLSTSVHPNFADLHAVIDTGSEYVVAYNFMKHTLLSISRFHANSTLSTALLGENTFKVLCKY
jgi:hypothetical protein